MRTIPDNYDLWEAHDIKNEMWLARRPVCSECDQHIQDEEAFYINGEWICEKCMDNYKRFVDDFCE